MYSQAQRIEAVNLFIETGFNHQAVKSTLGYPSRWSLDRWYKDYIRDGYVKKSRDVWTKYSEEEKKVAVKRYFELGKSLTKTVNELGYPSRPLLCKWIDELAPNTRKKTKPHKQYSDSQRIGAISNVYLNQSSVAQVIENIDIHKGTFYNWRKNILGMNEKEVVDKMKDDNLPDDVEDLKNMAESLRQEVHRLQLETAIWKGAAELIKKDPSVDPTNLTNREKTILIGTLIDRFALKELLSVLKLAKSSYYYQLGSINAADKYAELRTAIKEIFTNSNATWGYRRIWGALRTQKDPIVVSEKVVRKVMKADGLKVIYHKKKRRWSSYTGETSPAPPNLVKRNFHTGLPNFLWLTDITQFSLANFRCYLSPIIDCFDGAVVSWTASKNPNAELANNMLDEAIATLGKDDRPILHNDRGGHYRWPGWIKRCDAAGITRSMSKKGCTPDNSAMEGFFGRLKNEFFYYRDWQGVSFDEFVDELGAYIDYYNETRIKQSLGWKSPMQYRRDLGLIA